MSDREHIDDALAAATSAPRPPAERNQLALQRYLAALGRVTPQRPCSGKAAGGDGGWRLENGTVADVMTRDVISVPADASLREIVDTLVRHGVGAVPVVDPHRMLVGVVSASDLLGPLVTAPDPPGEITRPHAARPKAGRHAGEGTTHAETARELMTAPPITTTPDTSVVEAARTAAAAGVHRLPVVGPPGDLVGIVSRSDLLRVLRRDDEAIRAHLVDNVLAREIELDQLAIEVEVHEGVVTLCGEVDRKSRVGSLLAAVHSVAGVVDVHDQLTYRFDDTLLQLPDTRG